MARLTLEWDGTKDGSGTAYWANVTDDQINRVTNFIESVVGRADSIS